MKSIISFTTLILTGVLMSFCGKSGETEGPGGKTEYCDELVVGTYNIQYDNKNDTENPWSSRKVILEDILDEIDFDIFGVQEPYDTQIADMMEYLGDVYAFYGKDISGGQGARKHYNPIFYKKARFTILEDGAFWLSETPDVPNSKGWDANQVRMCNWIKFKDEVTGKELYHFNCHFDHLGETARYESAKLMVKRVKSIAGNTPAFVTGDFNHSQSTETYKILAYSDILADSYDWALGKKNSSWYTYNGYTYRDASTHSNRIDHVFVTTEKTRVLQWEIVNTAYKQKYPSDHFPVVIRWQFEK